MKELLFVCLNNIINNLFIMKELNYSTTLAVFKNELSKKNAELI